jgi:hypothetical protein
MLKKLVWLLVGFCVAPVALNAQSTNGSSTQMVREVATNWTGIGVLRFHSGTNYEVLQAQVWTNIVAKAEYNGKHSEMIMESLAGPIYTNFCDLRFQVIGSTLPFPPMPGPGLTLPKPPPLPNLPGIRQKE